MKCKKLIKVSKYLSLKKNPSFNNIVPIARNSCPYETMGSACGDLLYLNSIQTLYLGGPENRAIAMALSTLPHAVSTP